MSKFLQAVHYVISVTRPEELGRTKLAKVLFYADLDAYRRMGKPMTEACYVKRPHGPMPTTLYEATDRLQSERLIAEKRADYYGRVQHQFWSLEEPTLEGLSAHDVAVLNAYARVICENHTAASISDHTHNAAWLVADEGEEIPFAAFMIADGAALPTKNEIAHLEAMLGA